MRILFYMGRNDTNKSRVSWKMWKIERKARTVRLYWGRAVIQNRKVVPEHRLQEKTIVFATQKEAKQSVERRVKAKLLRGYERLPRRRGA